MKNGDFGDDTLKTCHPDRIRATRVVRMSGRIPKMHPVPCRSREFSPWCSDHKPCLEKTPCCVPVMTPILGIFRLRRRIRSDYAQDDRG